MGAALAVIILLMPLTPGALDRWALAASLLVGLALLGRLAPLSPAQRRATGYALLSLMAALAAGLLAYAAHPLGALTGAGAVVGVGLALGALVVARPHLAEALGLRLERTLLGRRYEARRMVEEVAEAAPAVLDLEPLVAMILERTVQTLDIRWGLFALWDRTERELHAVVARGLPQGATAARWPHSHPLAQWLLAGSDADRESALPPSDPPGGEPALDTAWIVPVRLREGPVGVFLYGPHTGAAPYTAGERSILDLLASQTAAAVANAQLFDLVARARREWLATFDALSDGVLLHDRQGRVLRANRALARLVGRPFDQIIAQPWFELIPAGPEARRVCRAAAEAGQAVAEYDLGYGDQRTLHVTVSPLAEGGDSCVHVVRDVTEERALHGQLAQAEKLAALGEMLSGVAHELNNPLTTIIGFSELLQDADVPERVRADLARIQRQAQRSARIVQGLLTFARRSRIQVGEVDINTVIEQTIEFMEPQLESHRVEVELALAEDLPPTLADGGRLQQVFLNLFTNALQAMSAAHGGGTLRLASAATPESIRITVADDGPGIPADLLRRVFDPFFTTKQVGEGTGLGLSICYGIVREHGGRIWAESTPGQGATFTVELPIRHASAPAEPEAAARQPTGRRLLVVEDDEAIVALISRVLGPAGHEILVGGDGEDGLQVLAAALERGQAPDLIVVDLKMPRLDGQGFYERVRRDYPALARRFLLITGDTVRPESRRFLEESGLPYLQKPFGIREIEQAVGRALAAHILLD